MPGVYPGRSCVPPAGTLNRQLCRDRDLRDGDPKTLSLTHVGGIALRLRDVAEMNHAPGSTDRVLSGVSQLGLRSKALRIEQVRAFARSKTVDGGRVRQLNHYSKLGKLGPYKIVTVGGRRRACVALATRRALEANTGICLYDVFKIYGHAGWQTGNRSGGKFFDIFPGSAHEGQMLIRGSGHYLLGLLDYLRYPMRFGVGLTLITEKVAEVFFAADDRLKSTETDFAWINAAPRNRATRALQPKLYNYRTGEVVNGEDKGMVVFMRIV